MVGPGVLGSVDFQIVPRNDVALVGLTDFPEELLLTSCFAALFGACLVATRVPTVIQDQQSRFRSGRDCPEFLRGRVESQTIFLPFRGNQVERSLGVSFGNQNVAAMAVLRDSIRRRCVTGSPKVRV